VPVNTPAFGAAKGIAALGLPEFLLGGPLPGLIPPELVDEQAGEHHLGIDAVCFGIGDKETPGQALRNTGRDAIALPFRGAAEIGFFENPPGLEEFGGGGKDRKGFAPGKILKKLMDCPLTPRGIAGSGE
jgi:hypothetical protein